MKKLIPLTILGLLLAASTVTSKAISLTDAVPVYTKNSLKFGPVTRPLTKSVAHGGNGGIQFDDIVELGSSNIYGVHSINISSGDIVDSIEVFYVLNNGSIQGTGRRGKPTNTPVSILLEDQKEEIVKIEGKIDGELVGQLTITTIGPNYVTKTYGPFGKKGTLSFEFEGQILAFYGCSDDSLDQIGVYSLEKLTRSDQYGNGSKNSTPFDNFSDSNYAPIVSLKSIYVSVVRNPAVLQCVLTEHNLLNGSVIYDSNPIYLRMDSDWYNITIEEGDQVISMYGTTGAGYLTQIQFAIAKGNGEIITFGPFGMTGTEAFHIRGNILGVYGEADKYYITKIGVYLLPN